MGLYGENSAEKIEYEKIMGFPPPEYDPKDVAFNQHQHHDQNDHYTDIRPALEGMNDGGTRIIHPTGALRESPAGKGMPALISPFAETRLAKWYELGARKYADRNWEKGLSFQNCTNSLQRHLIAWKKGLTDEDHMAAIAWNAFAIMHFQELGRDDLNDMPKYDTLDLTKE